MAVDCTVESSTERHLLSQYTTALCPIQRHVTAQESCTVHTVLQHKRDVPCIPYYSTREMYRAYRITAQ